LLLILAEPTARGATPSWSPPTEAERAKDALKGTIKGQVTQLTRPSAGEPAMGPYGDVATLPKAAPNAHWLPMEVMSDGSIVATVFVNLKPVRARLDTGTNINLMRESTAEQVGLLGPFVVRSPKQIKLGGETFEVLTAHADMVDVGPVRIKHAGFAIPQRDANVGVFPSLSYDAVIAYGALENTDLLFAIDQGLVGVFMPGEGKLAANAREVKLYADDTLQKAPLTNKPFVGAAGHLWTLAVVDDVLIPLRIDTGSHTTGWFKAPPSLPNLVVGDVGVGSIRPHFRGALELGNDVLLRSRTLISVANQIMQLAPIPVRPPTRSKGPDGSGCASGPCVSTSIDDTGRVCLDVDAVWQSNRAVAIIEATGLAGFVMMHVDVTQDGAHVCSRPLGLDKGRHKLSLLRWNVVDKAADKAACEVAPCVVIAPGDAS
jgi:hypothetical protein